MIPYMDHIKGTNEACPACPAAGSSKKDHPDRRLSRGEKSLARRIKSFETGSKSGKLGWRKPGSLKK